jgi:hypothetical protein
MAQRAAERFQCGRLQLHLASKNRFAGAQGASALRIRRYEVPSPSVTLAVQDTSSDVRRSFVSDPFETE